MLRIVGIGGGTGLPVLLDGLCKMRDVALSAIVTVTDNGGSSGRLRDAFGIPAVGDLRNCLVSLSQNKSVLAALFQHRFSAAEGLAGHSLGNLIVTALYEQTGSLKKAIEIAGALLPVQGRALASTETQLILCARFKDGSIARGESQITRADKVIDQLWTEPPDPSPSPEVLDTIREADAIVFAPGSLFTSLLPNMLVAGVAEEIRASHAVKIFVCNLMTQPGETDGFSASDHLRALEAYLGAGVINFCLVNGSTRRAASSPYRMARSKPVRRDAKKIRSMGAIPIEADLLDDRAARIRHDAVRLGRLVARLARESETQTIYHALPEPKEAVCLNHYATS